MSAAAVKKKPPTLEQEISALVEQSDAMRERAEELLDLYAEKHRPPGVPGPMLRRMWETRSLNHDPILALKYALKETGNT
jgi:hypothetical protein